MAEMLNPGNYARRNYPVENDAFAGMVRRMLRALARRVADGDVDGLADMVAISDGFEAMIGESVRALRDEHGYSWSDIGRATGVTRQAAQQRWGAS